MPHNDFITDYINVFDENGNILYSDLGVQFCDNNEIIVSGINRKFDKGYKINRKINDFVEEKYTISKVDYQNHPHDDFFRVTEIKLLKDGEEEKNRAPIHIENFNGNLAYNNNGTQNYEINNNDIDKVIEILNEKDIKGKEELIQIFNDYKKTKDKLSLAKAIALMSSSATLFKIFYDMLMQS